MMAAAAKFSLLLVVACLLLGVDARANRDPYLNSCEVSPPWTAPLVKDVDDELQVMQDPVLANRGKVVLVALTAASSGASMHQAHKLDALQSYFHGIGMLDVAFVLVNSVDSQEDSSALLHLNMALIMVQDTPSTLIWKKLSGRKDDVFVYDRCGRLTYNIAFPLSIIHPRQQMVESAVISTYLDDLCGNLTCQNNTSSASEDSADVFMIDISQNNLTDAAQDMNTTQEENILQLDYDTDIEDDHTEGMEHGTEIKLKQVPKEARPSPTPEPSGMWSYVQSIWNNAPWKKKAKADERLKNSVPKTRAEPSKDTSLDMPPTEDPDLVLCHSTHKSTCKAWTAKKINHAKTCCEFYNTSSDTQHFQKHCKHYTKARCKKVEVVLKCCPHKNQEELDIISKDKSSLPNS